MQQPDYIVFQCITEMESIYMEKANTEARIHAIGWAGLFNGFKGKDDPAINFAELLPYPDKVNTTSRSKLSEKTKQIIKEAIRKRELPTATLTSLAMLLDA